MKIVGYAGSCDGGELLWIYQNPPKAEPIVVAIKDRKLKWELYCNWVEILMEGDKVIDYRIITEQEAAAASSKISEFLAGQKTD